jgi:hypothetical protein
MNVPTGSPRPSSPPPDRHPRPQLAALAIGGASAAWRALGFSVPDDRIVVGGVELRLNATGAGITAWTLRHVATATTAIDGLTTTVTEDPPPPAPDHANGALGLDHVVIASPDFDRTADALALAGMPLRRVRDAGGFRQGFRRLGPAIMELVETPRQPPGPARFWGLVVVVGDLDGLSRELHPHLGAVRPAVQPGRRIATLRDTAGLGTPMAFMDPE